MKNKYEAIFIESIKFHHNSIVDYIKNNFLYEENKIEKNEIIFSNIIKFHNYFYFLSDFEERNEFYDLCCFNYSTLINLFISTNEETIKEIDFKTAIEENKIEVIYYLLTKENAITSQFFKENAKIFIKKIAVPPSVTSVLSKAFNGFSSLVRIEIPSSITTIENNAFYKCISLEQITILPSVKSIGMNAFAQCRSLTQITIPPFVTKID